MVDEHWLDVPVVVVPLGGSRVASVAGMVTTEGVGVGGHRMVQIQGRVAPYKALDSTLAPAIKKK